MLSARAGEEASAEGLAEGADDYLIKPFTARELLSRVASHLKMARIRMEATTTERTLRMSVAEGKERLERILASIQDAFVSLDARLRYSFVNINAACLYGVKKEGTPVQFDFDHLHQRHLVFLLLQAHHTCVRGVLTDMLGQNVWRFMVDTEDRVIRRNLERALKEKVDLVFDYHSNSQDRW
jgi:hypothetical protein